MRVLWGEERSGAEDLVEKVRSSDNVEAAVSAEQPLGLSALVRCPVKRKAHAAYHSRGNVFRRSSPVVNFRWIWELEGCQLAFQQIDTSEVRRSCLQSSGELGGRNPKINEMPAGLVHAQLIAVDLLKR